MNNAEFSTNNWGLKELSIEEQCLTEGGVIPLVIVGIAKLACLGLAGAAVGTASGYAAYGLVRLIDSTCER